MSQTPLKMRPTGLVDLPDEAIEAIFKFIISVPPPRRRSLHPTSIPLPSHVMEPLPAVRADNAFALALCSRRLLRLFRRKYFKNMAVSVLVRPPVPFVFSKSHTKKWKAGEGGGGDVLEAMQNSSGHNHRDRDETSTLGESSYRRRLHPGWLVWGCPPRPIEALPYSPFSAHVHQPDGAGESQFRLANPRVLCTSRVSHVQAITRLCFGVTTHFALGGLPTHVIRGYGDFLKVVFQEPHSGWAGGFNPEDVLRDLTQVVGPGVSESIDRGDLEWLQTPSPQRRCKSVLESLTLTHPKLRFTETAAEALLSVLCTHSDTLRTLHIHGIGEWPSCALLEASRALQNVAGSPGNVTITGPSPKDPCMGLEVDGVLGVALQISQNWGLLSALPTSQLPLEELRLPGFCGGYHVLATLLATYGPNLKILELSPVMCTTRNVPVPPPILDEESARDFWAKVAARVPQLRELSLGPMTYVHMSPLGIALIERSPLLRRLTLTNMSCKPADPACSTMLLLRAVHNACIDIEEVHVVDCSIRGPSRELSQLVGPRLRSFTGPLSWETSDDLFAFAHSCPNVEQLSLRCGEGITGLDCESGALHCLKTMGPGMRSLVISNRHMTEHAFVEAVACCSTLEDLELQCNPKLSVSLMESVLRAAGRNLRSLTIVAPVAVIDTSDDDYELLELIGRHCVVLESVYLPDLWDGATASSLRRRQSFFLALEAKLPYLDRARCHFGRLFVH